MEKELFIISPENKDILLCLIKKLNTESLSNYDKGTVFNKICNTLMNCVYCFKASMDVKDALDQIDVVVINRYIVDPQSRYRSCVQDSLLNIIGPGIVCECKYEKTKPKTDYFHRINSLLSVLEKGFGIVFSLHLAPKTLHERCVRFYQNSNRQHIIICITYDEILSVIEGSENLMDIIRFKVEAIKMNKENISNNFD